MGQPISVCTRSEVDYSDINMHYKTSEFYPRPYVEPRFQGLIRGWATETIVMGKYLNQVLLQIFVCVGLTTYTTQ
jgi:hypothetical protein